MKLGSANRCRLSRSLLLLGSPLLFALSLSSGCTESSKCDGGAQGGAVQIQGPECGATNKEAGAGSPATAGQGKLPAATPEQCAQRDPANCGPGCMPATGTRYDLAKACTFAPAPAGCFAPQFVTIPASPTPQVACDGAVRHLTSPQGHTIRFPSGCAPKWPVTLVDSATVNQIFSSKTACTP